MATFLTTTQENTMNFLQQPVLFASEPTTGLVGLGLFLTVAAIFVVVSLLVAYALSPTRDTQPESPCKREAQPPQQVPTCAQAALS
jgi:hypothetical protein